MDIIAVFTDNIPSKEEMIFGELYISLKYSTASHLCACGCGTLTVTPIGNKADPDRHEWDAYVNEGAITFDPSIENPGCGAHYHIEKSKIRFC